MSTYQLFDPAGPGPALNAFSGSFQAGVIWKILNTAPNVMWLEGYWWWVPAGGDTTPQKFATWNLSGAGTGILLPASVVTAPAAFTPNAWNFVALPAPIQVTTGTPYVAATGWNAVHGFPIASNTFNAAGTFPNGITQGPLFAYADGTAGGAPAAPFGMAQGLFSTAANPDPAVNMPGQGSNSSNFGISPQVSTTPPPGYSGPYQLYPNNFAANSATVLDLNVNYDVGTEVILSQPFMSSSIRYFSPAGAASLATRASWWNIASQLETAVIAVPEWSGAAGSGWVEAHFTSPPVLATGRYRVSVYNSAGTGGGWSAKDASTDYWGTGDGANGIVNGPLTAPSLAAASQCWEYDGSLPGATPPYSNGTQEPGQCPFGQLPGGQDTFPQLYVHGLAQNYWVTPVGTPVQAAIVADPVSERRISRLFAVTVPWR